MMKGRAGSLHSAEPSQDECNQMQRDLLSLLATQLSGRHLHQLAARQLCMALALASLPFAAQTLGPLLDHLTSAGVPGEAAMLTLEYLAEEVLGLSLFGPGRVDLSDALQIVLRSDPSCSIMFMNAVHDLTDFVLPMNQVALMRGSNVCLASNPCSETAQGMSLNGFHARRPSTAPHRSPSHPPTRQPHLLSLQTTNGIVSSMG